MTDKIKEALTEHYGERCPVQEPGCPCCDAWSEFGALETAQARIAELEAQPDYIYIGKDGKSVTARELEDRVDELEAEIAKLSRTIMGAERVGKDKGLEEVAQWIDEVRISNRSDAVNGLRKKISTHEKGGE